MKKNEDLQKEVQDAIKWEPLLNAAEIGVTVSDGIVTLTGIVDSYSKKVEAEEATKKVKGVKAVVEKIDVQLGTSFLKTDSEIAHEIINSFRWNWEVPNDKVNVKVENGWVSLGGEVFWNYQREAAKKAASTLIGVKGVSSNITIKSETLDLIEKTEIERALARNWAIDEKEIMVKVVGNRVTLNGTASSWYQKDEAGKIAWNAPGVSYVDNELIVGYSE